MRSPTLAVMACMAAGLAAPVAAQTVEIVPFGGYRLAGSFEVSSEPGSFEVKDAAAWGGSVTVKLAEDGELEALFARQHTRLTSEGLFTSQPRFPLTMEIYHLGGNYLFGVDGARLRPYVGLGVGATRLVPGLDELENETRFSASVAGGLKAYVGAHLGLRLEVRGFATAIESDRDVFCRGFGPCRVRTTGSDLSQVEARGGLIFRF
jgi:hypothetical protein